MVSLLTSCTMWKVKTVFLCTNVLLFLVQCGLCERDEVYEEEYRFRSDDLSLRKFWGIQDVTASVGKLFRYKIPKDAFKGTVVYYEVEGEDNHSLPKWLMFDNKTATLEGIPSIDDFGDTRINVKAYDDNGHFVSDMFVLEVYPLFDKNTNNKRKCKKGEEVMMISLAINKDINEITPKLKVSVLKVIAHRLRIPTSTVLFLPPNWNVELMSDRRPCTVEKLNTSLITWQIGCNERIWAEKLDVVDLVQKYLNDGTFSRITTLPFIKSHISSTLNPFRVRRHLPAQQSTDDPPNEGDGNTIDEDDAADDDMEDEDDMDDNDSSETLPIEPTSPILAGMSATLTGPFRNEQNDTLLPTKISKKPIVDSPLTNESAIFAKENDNSANNDDDENATEQIEEDIDDEIYNNSSQPSESSGTPGLASIPVTISTSIISSTPVTKSPTTEEDVPVIPKRYPPRVEQNLDEILAVAGKPYIVKIPENIFADDEDGNTRNLTLRLNASEPWIYLRPDTQELYIFAMLDKMSKYQFEVEAIDSDNNSCTNELIVNVPYPSNVNVVNFEISLHMKLPENKTSLNLTSQIDLVKRLAAVYGNENINNITIRNVTFSADLFVLTWTNDTLPATTCDNETILNLLNVLTEAPWDMNVKEEVKESFRPLVEVEKVTWRGTQLCDSLPPAQGPKTEINFKPQLRNHIDNVTVTVGELLVLKVPDDTFFDADVKYSSSLKLALKPFEGTSIQPDNWLQFDSVNHEIYGLPLAKDIGSKRYQLICEDHKVKNEEWTARNVLDVVVENAAPTHYNVEFSMKLNNSYEEFLRSSSLRRTFVEKIAQLFDNSSIKSIVISGFSPGSLVVTWHNKTLPIKECPEAEIVSLRRVLFDDDDKLNDNVNKIMQPTFTVLSADVSPIGICEGGLTEVHPLPPEVSTGSSMTLFNNIYFTTSILPVAIIVSMILVAGLIACILYKRQRSAKWTLGEDDRRTYRNKGIPVIFQDELEERLEPTNKSPIIMKEEKPPLPPPEYQKTLPMATTALLSDFDDSYQHGSSGTYKSRSVERNGRSKQTPIYRKPPPYVPQ